MNTKQKGSLFYLKRGLLTWALIIFGSLGVNVLFGSEISTFISGEANTTEILTRKDLTTGKTSTVAVFNQPIVALDNQEKPIENGVLRSGTIPCDLLSAQLNGMVRRPETIEFYCEEK